MAGRHQVKSGAPFNAGRGLTHGHRYREGRPPRSVGIGVPPQKHTHRLHLRGPHMGATCVPEVQTKVDHLLLLLRRESATITPALDMCPFTSAAIHLSLLQWKALASRKGRKRIHGSAGDECDRRKGWRVHGQGRHLKDYLLQIISVNSQVAISRRVHRYKLALRDRQATTGRREEEGRKLPMEWGCHINVE